MYRPVKSVSQGNHGNGKGKTCFGPSRGKKDSQEGTDAEKESYGADCQHQAEPELKKSKKVFLQVARPLQPRRRPSAG